MNTGVAVALGGDSGGLVVVIIVLILVHLNVVVRSLRAATVLLSVRDF